jgi:hypothetical protein
MGIRSELFSLVLPAYLLNLGTYCMMVEKVVVQKPKYFNLVYSFRLTGIILNSKTLLIKLKLALVKAKIEVKFFLCTPWKHMRRVEFQIL